MFFSTRKPRASGLSKHQHNTTRTHTYSLTKLLQCDPQKFCKIGSTGKYQENKNSYYTYTSWPYYPHEISSNVVNFTNRLNVLIVCLKIVQIDSSIFSSEVLHNKGAPRCTQALEVLTVSENGPFLYSLSA